MIYNGKYTVRNKTTGEHRTFQIKTQKEEARFKSGCRLIALLRGPDNQSDYTGFGEIENDSIKVWYSKRGKNGKRSEYEWFARMIIGLVNEDETWCKHYELMVSRNCMKCNRELTTPESIEAGIGPICRG